MAIFEIDIDGSKYEIEAENENKIPAIVNNIRSETKAKPIQASEQSSGRKASFFTQPEREFGKRVLSRVQRYEQPTKAGEVLGLKQGTVFEGIIGTPERLLRAAGAGLGTIGDFASMEALQGARVFDEALGGYPSQFAKETLSGVSKLSKGIKETKIYKSLSDLSGNYLKQVAIDYANLSPEDQANIGSLADIGLNLPSGAVSIGLGKKAVGVKLEELASKKALQEAETLSNITKSDDKLATAVLPKKIEDVPFKDIASGKVKQVIDESGEILDVSQIPKKELSGTFFSKVPVLKEFFEDDIEQSLSKVLMEKKAPQTRPLGDYLKVAVTNNIKSPTPAYYAGENLTKALQSVISEEKRIGKVIGDIIDDNAYKNIKTTGIGKKFEKNIIKRMGDPKADLADIADDALEIEKITAPKTAIFSDKSIASKVQSVIDELNDLPQFLKVTDAQLLKKRLDNMVDWIAEGKFQPKDNTFEKTIKEIRHTINKKILKEIPELKQVNEQYKYVAGIRSYVNDIIGRPVPLTDLTKHAASIMKRAIFSPADSGIVPLFRAIKDITKGQFDLMQDAVYANVAMRLSGDAVMIQKALPFGMSISQGMSNLFPKLSLAGTSVKAISNIVKKKNANKKMIRVNEWYNMQQRKFLDDNLLKPKE